MNCFRVYFLSAAVFLAAAGSLCANPVASASPPDQAMSPAADSAAHEAPIVLGRSIGVRHKTKMHHVRLKPDEIFSDEAPAQND